MFKKATYLFFGGLLTPLIIWFSGEVYSFTKVKLRKLDTTYERSMINATHYNHIKEGIEDLKDGQKEIRSYILNHNK